MNMKMRAFSREIRWLIGQMKPFARLQAISLITIVCGSALTLIDPLVMKWLIDRVLPLRQLSLLGLGTSLFAAVYLARLALLYLGSLVGFIAVQKMVFHVRMKMLHELDNRSATYHDANSVGDLLYRIEQDVARIGELGGDILPTAFRMILVAVMVVTTMCILNTHLAVLVLPLLPVFYILQLNYRRQLTIAAEKTQNQSGKMTSILQEHLLGVLQLQLLNRTQRHARSYARAAAVGAQSTIHQRGAEIRFSAAYLTVIVIGSSIILGYGGYEVIHNRLTIGGLVAFYSYVTRLFEPMSIAVDLRSRVQRVGASVRRVMEIVSNDDAGNAVSSSRVLADWTSLSVEFRSVTFSHQNHRAVLKEVSFAVSPGEALALVGFSGCGKSTLAYLMVRMYEPDSGSILVNGHNVSTLGKKELRSMVALVPQEPILFDASLRENLLYGDPSATSWELDDAIRTAQLGNLVQRLPHGLDEPLGPLGRRLSGGEKKRVALARAVLRNPRILILDEATSGLDAVTSGRLLEALQVYCEERTLILISHKPQTIFCADRIIVLDEGRIVDQGRDVELRQRCGLYRELLEVKEHEILDAVHNNGNADVVASDQTRP
jgi:ABC-type multidrug transport system fused ATPase/permease subunit